jgi:Delta14-sterol reductase
VREFFYGVERDPAWAGVDLKMFSYRPSLIGLALINVSFAFAQWERHRRLAVPLLLYEAFTLLYVANYFHFEHGMLSTWDVLEERFGWSLVWGDYVLVPFFYSLPGWYLIDRLAPPSPAAVAGLVAMYALGFWLLRGANEQKHRFKLDPAAPIWGRPPETLDGRLGRGDDRRPAQARVPAPACRTADPGRDSAPVTARPRRYGDCVGGAVSRPRS